MVQLGRPRSTPSRTLVDSDTLVYANLHKRAASKREPQKASPVRVKIVSNARRSQLCMKMKYRGAIWLGGCRRVIACRCAACALLVDARWWIWVKAAWLCIYFLLGQVVYKVLAVS